MATTEDLKLPVKLAAAMQDELPLPLALALQRAFGGELGVAERLRAMMLVYRLCLQWSGLCLLRAHWRARPRSAGLEAALGMLHAPGHEGWVELTLALAHLPLSAQTPPTLARVAEAVRAWGAARHEGQTLPHAWRALRQRILPPHNETWNDATWRRPLDAMTGLLQRTLELLRPLGELELLRRKDERAAWVLRGVGPAFQSVELDEEAQGWFEAHELVLRDRQGGVFLPMSPLLLLREQDGGGPPEVLLLDHAARARAGFLGPRLMVALGPGPELEGLRAMLDAHERGSRLDGAALRARAQEVARLSLKAQAGRYNPTTYLERPRVEGALFPMLPAGEPSPGVEPRMATEPPVCLIAGGLGAGRGALLCRLAERALEGATPKDAVLLSLDADPRASLMGRLHAALALSQDPDHALSLDALLERLGDAQGRVTLLVEHPLSEDDPILALRELDEAALTLRRACERVGRPWVKLLVAVRGERLRAALGDWTRQHRASLFNHAFCFQHFPSQGEPSVPYLALGALDAQEAATVYGWVAHASPNACPAPWDKLPELTRAALRTPLLLQLHHQAHEGVARPEAMDEAGLWAASMGRTFGHGRGAQAVERAAADLAWACLDLGAEVPHEEVAVRLLGAWWDAQEGSPERAVANADPLERLWLAGLLRPTMYGWRFLWPSLLPRWMERVLLAKGQGSALVACQEGLGLPNSSAREDALALLVAQTWVALKERSLATLRHKGSSPSRTLLALALVRVVESALPSPAALDGLRMGLETLVSQPQPSAQLVAWKDALFWHLRPCVDHAGVLVGLTELCVQVCQRLHELEPHNPSHLQDLASAWQVLGHQARALDVARAEGYFRAEEEVLHRLGKLWSSQRGDVKPGQSVALARSFRSMGDLVRQRLERLDEPSVQAREGLVVGYLSRAAALLAAQPDEARRLYEDAQVLAERALEAAPGEPSQLEALSTIYHVLMRLDGREGVEAAARWGRRLVEVYEQLAFLYDGERGALQNLAAAHNQLGDLLEGEEPYEAWGCYVRAKELREALVAATPDDFGVLQALANSLHRLGRLDARLDPLRAKGWFQQEVAACARLVALRPGDDDLLRNLSVAYYRLAELLQDEDPREARALFEKDAALSRELVKRAPSDVQRLRDLLSSYQKLYELRVSDSDDNLAELAELEMEAVQQLGAAAPQDPALRRHVLRLLKHMDEREPSLAPARQARWMRQQVELVEGLLEREPGDAELRERFARACRRLGELHLVSKPEAARTWLVRGLEALERLPAGEPGNHLEQAAYFYKALARLEEEEHPSSASVWLQQFVDAVEQLLDRHGENPALVWDLAETCDKLGKMRADRTPREAAQWFTRAMNARNRLLAFHSAPGAMFQAYETRRNPLGHASKGWAQLQGWLQGAQETLERLLVLDRQNPNHQRDLAVCHLLLGDIEAKRGIEPEARRLYELGVSRLNRQVSLFPKNPRLLTDAGHAYARLEELERGKDPERAKHWALLQAEAQKRLEALYAEALNPGPRGS